MRANLPDRPVNCMGQGQPFLRGTEAQGKATGGKARGSAGLSLHVGTSSRQASKSSRQAGKLHWAGAAVFYAVLRLRAKPRAQKGPPHF
jgi:hypothetical protein